MLAGIGLDVGSRRLQEIYRPSTRIGHDVVEVEVQSRGLEEHSRRASLFPPRITRNDCRRRSRSRRLAASDVNSPADEKAAYKPSGNTLRLALGPQVSSSTHATPGTERWEKKARFTSCTNDLCIVFSERRMFGGTTAIAESFPKPDDRAGCPDKRAQLPLACTAFGVFLKPGISLTAASRLTSQRGLPIAATLAGNPSLTIGG